MGISFRVPVQNVSKKKILTHFFNRLCDDQFKVKLNMKFNSLDLLDGLRSGLVFLWCGILRSSVAHTFERLLTLSGCVGSSSSRSLSFTDDCLV